MAEEYEKPTTYTITRISNGWLATLTYREGEIEAICFEGDEREALARAAQTFFPTEEEPAPKPEPEPAKKEKEKVKFRFVHPQKPFEEEQL